MGETSTSSVPSSPGGNCLASCLQWQVGGARAQWLWSSEAGNTDVDADFDDDDDLFWPLVMTKMIMVVMLVSGWSMKRW